MICPGYIRTIYSDPRQPFVSNQSWSGGTSSLNRSVISKDRFWGGQGHNEKSWNRNIWPYRYILYFLTNRLCQAVVQYYAYIGLVLSLEVLCIQSVDRVERGVPHCRPCGWDTTLCEIPRYVIPRYVSEIPRYVSTQWHDRVRPCFRLLFEMPTLQVHLKNSGNPTDVMSQLHCGGSVREFRNSTLLTSVGAPRISDVCRDQNRNQES